MKIAKQSSICLILVFIILSMTGCKNNNNQNALKEKINTEISYIDNDLIKILNEINNVNYTKYSVQVEKTEEKSDNGSDSTQSDEKGEGTQESGKGDGESEKNGQNQDSKESGKSNSSGNQNSEEKKNFTMKSNNILGKEKNINWDELKNIIETLYTSWTTISSDLKKTGVSNESVTNFETNIDLLAISIKNEDETGTINNIINLYRYLPQFVRAYQNEKDGRILELKYKLLLCYKYSSVDDWEEYNKAVSDLKMSFSNLLNQQSDYTGKSRNIENAFSIINSISNEDEMREKEIFFIKYRNLMQELNVISDI
ncbi:MAG: hypothetical protein IJ690_04035 [Clostridia bacterium]|nr:hypothetical protein [Clostridia bacterium]